MSRFAAAEMARWDGLAVSFVGQQFDEPGFVLDFLVQNGGANGIGARVLALGELAEVGIAADRAPFGLDLHDFPLVDSLHFLMIKVLALKGHNSAVSYNLYFLLTFPLTTLTSIYDRLRPDRPTHATGVGGGFVDPTVRLDVHFLPRGSSSPSSV